MLSKIKKQYKEYKDIINTLILVLIAVYTYMEINYVYRHNIDYLERIIYFQNQELMKCENYNTTILYDMNKSGLYINYR